MITSRESDKFEQTDPSLIYIVASTNRTGSYLLCEGLDDTDVAGHPTESLIPEFRDNLCPSRNGIKPDFSASVKSTIRQGRTANGVFGVKVHWDQVEDIALESGYDGPTHVFLLKEFPGARYVHLVRQDTLAQAISLSIAQQTDEWWRIRDVDNPWKNQIEPLFRAPEILMLEKDLIRQREAWEAFFIAEGITPLKMDYESLAADYRGAVRRVLDFLGLEGSLAETIPEPRLQKQGDARNALWESWLKPPQEVSFR